MELYLIQLAVGIVIGCILGKKELGEIIKKHNKNNK